MGINADAQTRIDENVIDNPELLECLDRRSWAQVELKSARAGFELRDSEARAEIAKLELEPGQVVRCGAYRIAHVEAAPARDVAFTVEPKPRISIRALDER